MKNFLAIICLLLAGCGSRMKTADAEIWPITPKNELASNLIELDSISRTIMGDTDSFARELDIVAQLDMCDANEKELQQLRDSAVCVWRSFIRLCNEEKRKEAFELYQNNQPLFLIALQHSTARFYLHKFITAKMAADYLPEEETLAVIISDFEIDLLSAESVLLFSDGQTVPGHYEDLLWTLADCYCEAERWDKALEINDKLLKCNQDVEINALGISMHRAGILNSMGDTAASLKLLKQMKVDIEEGLKEADENEFQPMQLENVLQVINDKIAELDSLRN